MIAQANGVAKVAENAASPTLPPGWSKLDHAVLGLVIRELTPKAIRVYLAILAHANEHGRAWPGQERLAALTGIHTRAVRAATDELRRAGLISTRKSGVNGTPMLIYTLERPAHMGRSCAGTDRRENAGGDNDDRHKRAAREPSDRRAQVERPALLCRLTGTGAPPNHHHEPDTEPVMMNGSARASDGDARELATEAGRLRALKRAGVSPGRARKLASTIGPEIIEAGLAELTARNGTVDNPGGYLAERIIELQAEAVHKQRREVRAAQSAQASRVTEIDAELAAMTLDDFAALMRERQIPGPADAAAWQQDKALRIDAARRLARREAQTVA